MRDEVEEKTEEELELETLEVETRLVAANVLEIEPEVEIKVPQSESLAVIRARKQAHQAKLRGGK